MNLSIDVLHLAIVSAAAGRITHGFTSDDIFRPAREWVFRRSAPENARTADGQPWSMMHEVGPDAWAFDPHLPTRQPGFFGKLVECSYCMSFWVALGSVLLWWLLGDLWVAAMLPFAIWAAANWYAVRAI